MTFCWWTKPLVLILLLKKHNEQSTLHTLRYISFDYCCWYKKNCSLTFRIHALCNSFLLKCMCKTSLLSLTIIFSPSIDYQAHSAYHGIGVVKLMGRSSGFIAMQSSLASGQVDICLIPEVTINYNQLCPSQSLNACY